MSAHEMVLETHIYTTKGLLKIIWQVLHCILGHWSHRKWIFKAWVQHGTVGRLCSLPGQWSSADVITHSMAYCWQCVDSLEKELFGVRSITNFCYLVSFQPRE